jgi:hypothetical protein
MSTPQDSWGRLAGAARNAAPRPADPPLGFATRVVARWKETATAELASPWELLSLKSLAFAVVVMLVSLGASYQSVAEQFAGDALEPAALISLLSEE